MNEKTKNYLQKLFNDNEAATLVFKGTCHDCDEDMTITIAMVEDGKLIITGGALYPVELNTKTDVYFKCDNCFNKHRLLTDYQETEIYSRVVGYLRPIKQYNPGKKEEFKDRKMFDMGKYLKE